MREEDALSRRAFLAHIGQTALTTTGGLSTISLLQGCHSSPAQPVGPKSFVQPAHTTAPLPAKFTDVTKAAGLDFIQASGTCERHYFPEQVAAGATLFDANGDGHLDIYFPQPKPLGVCKANYPQPLRHRLYINDGKGNFSLKPDAFGGVETDYGISAAVGDYNNDGHPDLYVCCYGRNTLFRNRGDGTFEDVTLKAGVGLKGFSTGAVWFDYDRDGYLDLLVCRYCVWSVEGDNPCTMPNGKPGVCPPSFYDPATDVLYHNNRNGTFTEVTHKAGLGGARRRSLGAVAADFDGDGWLDLFVANDIGPNFLYHNNHDGTFEEVATQQGTATGLSAQPQANMGVAVGDYDEDGYLDICVTTFTKEPYTVYHNESGKYFTDVSMETGVAVPTTPFLGFGCGFFDARNSGRLDLFFANGHVNPFIRDAEPKFTYKERNQLLLNDGAGKFVESLDSLPADDVRAHKGACFGDIDNDGRIDVLVTAANDRPTLLHNDSPPANWLLLRLMDKHGCATPIGTRCLATYDSKKRLRVILGGGSYGGDSDTRVHFGLGTAKMVDRLEIQWLSGKKQVMKNVPVNQILTIKEAK